jgi:glutamine amidotransferase
MTNTAIKLGIIDYKAGNSQSVAASVAKIEAQFSMVRNPDDLSQVDAVILPGVGSAGATMASLRDQNLIEPLSVFVTDRRRPYLGICVGLQVIFDRSEEDTTECLGWVPGSVHQFDRSAVRVPQIGWNKIEKSREHLIFDGIDGDCFGYFVNSYHAFPADEQVIVGTVDYDGASTAIVCSENIWATQFHIEKSGPVGLRMLKNFVDHVAKC